ncbi:hypothetical protein HI914_06529 [Erysiphe necator]|nr:hypothetical protein HI914_06529 [Erysiphe necator]
MKIDPHLAQFLIEVFKSKKSAETFQQLDKISATFVEGCAILQWAELAGIQYELALEGTDFLSNDGGVANQLKSIVDYGSVDVVLHYEMDTEENPYVEFGRVHAPMLAVPVEAPPGAAFLALDQRKRTVGTLVTDSMESGTKMRILEVSPQSHKLCAIAAIQHAEILTAGLNARSMGDNEAISDRDLSEHFAKIVLNTKHNQS